MDKDIEPSVSSEEMPERLMKKLTSLGELTLDIATNECGGDVVKAFSCIKYLCANGYIREKRNGKFEVLDTVKSLVDFKKPFSESFIKNFIDVVHRDSIRALFALEDEFGIECDEFMKKYKEAFTFNPIPFLESCGAVVRRNNTYYNAIPVESFGTLLDFLTNAISGELKDYERDLCFERWAFKVDDDDDILYDNSVLIDFGDAYDRDESGKFSFRGDDYEEYVEEDDRDEEGRIILDPDVLQCMAEIEALKDKIERESKKDNEPEEKSVEDEFKLDEDECKRAENKLKAKEFEDMFAEMRSCKTDEEKATELENREIRLNRIKDEKRLLHATIMNQFGSTLETDFVVTDSFKDVITHAVKHCGIQRTRSFFGYKIDVNDLKASDACCFYGFVKKIHMGLGASSVDKEKVLYPDTEDLLPKYFMDLSNIGLIKDIASHTYAVIDKEKSYSLPFIQYTTDGFSSQLIDKGKITFYVQLESDKSVLESIGKKQREIAVKKYARNLIFTNKYADMLTAKMNLDRYPLDIVRLTFMLNGAKDVATFARGLKTDEENYDYATAALDEVDSISVIIDEDKIVLDNNKTVIEQLDEKDLLRLNYDVIFRVLFKCGE